MHACVSVCGIESTRVMCLGGMQASFLWGTRAHVRIEVFVDGVGWDGMIGLVYEHACV